MKITMLFVVVVCSGAFAFAWDHDSLLEGSAPIEIAHSGGTDKCGCHTNGKTGDYHCHTRT